jgi:hypothetical protein
VEALRESPAGAPPRLICVYDKRTFCYDETACKKSGVCQYPLYKGKDLVQPPALNGEQVVEDACTSKEKHSPHYSHSDACFVTPELPPNISDLRNHLRLLDRLLSDPCPGLMTWRVQYAGAVETLLEFFVDKE